MKINHINLAGGFRGGERQTELLIRALDELGVQQRLLCSDQGKLKDRFADLPSLEVRPVKKPFYFRGGQIDGDIVHAHENKGAHLAHIAHRFGKGLPYIITRRIVRRPSSSRFTRDMYLKAARIVGVCQAVSDDLRDYEPQIESRTIYSVRSELPCDPEQAQAIRERFKGKTIILNMAALVMGQKGQHVLIEAARDLLQKHQDLVFLCCGDGPDAETLKSMAADLPDFHFEGFVRNVGDYMAAADIYVMPSLWEGLGTVALDAMSFSLPVVASAVDGLPEIVKAEDTGLLVPAKDAQSLSAALDRILKDPDLRKTLGQQAREFAESFTPARMAEQYLREYQAILGR